MNLYSFAGIFYPQKNILKEGDDYINYRFLFDNEKKLELEVKTLSNYTFLELNFNDVLFAKHRDRYIYQSLDYGQSWRKVLTLVNYKIRKFFSISNGSYLIGVIDGNDQFKLLLYDKNFNLIKENKIGDTFWHSHKAIDENNGTIIYAEYPYNGTNFTNHVNPKLIMSDDFGHTWKVIFELIYPEIKHWHTLQYDKLKNVWIATSGDTSMQSKWFLSEDNGKKWRECTDKKYILQECPSKSQSAHRTTVFEYDKEYYYWATDDLLGDSRDYFILSSGKRKASSKFYKSEKDNFKIIELANLGIHIRSMIDIGDAWILFSEAQYVSYNSQVFLIFKNELGKAYLLFDFISDKKHGGTNSLTMKSSIDNTFFSLFGRKIFKNQDSQILKFTYHLQTDFSKNQNIIYSLSDFINLNENFWFLEEKSKKMIKEIIFFKNNLKIICSDENQNFYLIYGNDKKDFINMDSKLNICTYNEFEIGLDVIEKEYLDIFLVLLEFDSEYNLLVTNEYKLQIGQNLFSIKKLKESCFIKPVFKIKPQIKKTAQLHIKDLVFLEKKEFHNEEVSKNMNLIPIECFLNRVFPLSFYKDDADKIINEKIYKPRKDCEEYKLFFPMDWESLDKKEDRNWRMQLQGWAMFHPIMNFFDEYENKEKIIQYFFDVANDWYEKYGDDLEDIVTSRMPESYAWYDMSVGFRALVIAFFKNRIDSFNLFISTDNFLLLEKLIDKHIAHLRLEKVFSLNNHGMFQIQGLMALIQLRGIEKYTTEYHYALTKMEDLILSQYDRNGVHLEHSPHYHFYALTTFENLLLNDWYEEKPIIKEVVEKANYIKKWLVDPLKRPACIGDSIMTIQKSVDFNNTLFNKKYEVITEDKKFVYSNFNNSGYFIFRTEWNSNLEKSTYLFFMGMYHRKTHKHRDCLSFEWFDNGKKIICDGGKYGYVSDKYRKYFLSYKAHNTLEIEGFDILKIKPYESAIEYSEYKNSILKTKAKLDYPAIKFSRTLHLKANRWLLIEDDVWFAKARNIVQWLHLEKDFNFVNLINNKLLFKEGKRDLIIHCLSDDIDVDIYKGDKDNLQGFVSENDFIFDENYAIGFKKYLKEGRVVTILALDNKAYFDALSYIDAQRIYELRNTQLDLDKEVLIKNIKHKNLLNINESSFEKGKTTYSTIINEMLFNFYFDNKETKNLIVFLPGAIDRSKYIYNFQRYSWSDDIEYSTISMLDPTITEDNNLSIGWFQGLWNNFGIENFAVLIKKILELNKIEEENVIFVGSSAGGFSALKMANYFLSSKVLAINPQIYIYEYHQSEYEKLLKYSYAPYSGDEVLKEYKKRLEVNIDYSMRKAPVFIYQNESDEFHLNKHLNIYLKSLTRNYYQKIKNIQKILALNVVLYNDPESGHSPPDKEITLKILDQIINSKDMK